MEISVVRKRVNETIDRAKRRAADRRSRVDEAGRDFDQFLERTAVPLFRQIANVLRADRYAFNVFTPSGSVRLMSERHTEDYIEIVLDTGGEAPQIVGHTSHRRGRRVVESERTIGGPTAVTEDDLLAFVLKELEPLVEK
jgi:hypothetical protein